MEKNKDYIDKLYEDKFSKFESNISVDDWAKLSTKLSKVNFFKFSFSTFNAYFLTAIVSFAAIATYFTVNNVNLSDKIELLEHKIEVLQEQQLKNNINPLLLDTLELEESKITETIEVKKEEKIITKPQKKEVQKTNQLPEKTKSDSSIVKKDSLIAATPDTSAKKPKKIIRRIKKQVIIKQDKVVIKDTVRIKKAE